MKILLKKIRNILGLIIFFITAFGFSKGQDKYSYATYHNGFSNDRADAYYLVISDPVKNWYQLSKDKREEWEINFRVKANRQIGYEFMRISSSPTPAYGNYERYSSMAETREAIQGEVNKFKEDFKGYRKPVKIIYVDLYQY